MSERLLHNTQQHPARTPGWKQEWLSSSCSRSHRHQDDHSEKTGLSTVRYKQPVCGLSPWSGLPSGHTAAARLPVRLGMSGTNISWRFTVCMLWGTNSLALIHEALFIFSTYCRFTPCYLSWAWGSLPSLTECSTPASLSPLGGAFIDLPHTSSPFTSWQPPRTHREWKDLKLHLVSTQTHLAHLWSFWCASGVLFLVTA